MEEFEFNKTGNVYKCLELDTINNSNLIPDRIKEECKDKFNKSCYFKYGTATKVGKLIGIEINTKLNELYYILKDNKDTYYIFCNNTVLKRL